MSQRRRTLTPALARLTTVERGQLLGELLSAHPDLVDQVEKRARVLWAVVDADEVAESVESTLREVDAHQLALRAGRVVLGLHDVASQIGLGLLRGLARCRCPVEYGTVLAYADPDVTDDLAWSVFHALTEARVNLPDDALDRLPIEWGPIVDLGAHKSNQVARGNPFTL